MHALSRAPVACIVCPSYPALPPFHFSRPGPETLTTIPGKSPAARYACPPSTAAVPAPRTRPCLLEPPAWRRRMSSARLNSHARLPSVSLLYAHTDTDKRGLGRRRPEEFKCVWKGGGLREGDQCYRGSERRRTVPQGPGGPVTSPRPLCPAPNDVQQLRRSRRARRATRPPARCRLRSLVACKRQQARGRHVTATTTRLVPSGEAVTAATTYYHEIESEPRYRILWR